MDRAKRTDAHEPTPDAERIRDENAPDRADDRAADAPNPPHTTTGKITSPKFGSAGSGGLEYEPGPERD